MGRLHTGTRYDVDTAIKAETLAETLANQHCCDWKYQTYFEPLEHWLDEEGHYREIDRIELVNLGNGRGQFNCLSETVRMSTDRGDIQWLAGHVGFWLAAWLGEEWMPEE